MRMTSDAKKIQQQFPIREGRHLNPCVQNEGTHMPLLDQFRRPDRASTPTRNEYHTEQPQEEAEKPSNVAVAEEPRPKCERKKAAA